MSKLACSQVSSLCASTTTELTFEVESFVPARVQCASLYLGLQAVLLVRQQRHPDIRVRRARNVLRRQFLGLQNKETHAVHPPVND